MDYQEIMTLPETQRMVVIAEMLGGLQQDAEATARAMCLMKVPNPLEVAERWRPVIQEGVDKLSDAQKLLRKVRLKSRTGLGWMKANPNDSLLKAIVDVSLALSGFLARLTAMQTEVRSIEMIGLVRSSVLNDLPPPTRKAILVEAHRAQLEDSGG